MKLLASLAIVERGHFGLDHLKDSSLMSGDESPCFWPKERFSKVLRMGSLKDKNFHSCRLPGGPW